MENSLASVVDVVMINTGKVKPAQPSLQYVTSVTGKVDLVPNVFSKTVHLGSVTGTEDGSTRSESAFLDIMTSTRDVSWISEVQLAGQTVKFKLGIVAELTAISTATHQLIGTPSKALCASDSGCRRAVSRKPETWGTDYPRNYIFCSGIKDQFIGSPCHDLTEPDQKGL